MNISKKYVVSIALAMALAMTPLMTGIAYAEAPKARAIQNGVSLDDSGSTGDLLNDIACVGGIEAAENADHTVCYLVPDGIPTPDYATTPIPPQTGTLDACPAVGGFGATQECFSTLFDISLFSPGHWRFVIEFYDGQNNLIDVKGIDFRNHSFFVLPESPVGVAALIVSSLAVLGGFMFLRNRNRTANLPI